MSTDLTDSAIELWTTLPVEARCRILQKNGMLGKQLVQVQADPLRVSKVILAQFVPTPSHEDEKHLLVDR